MNMTRLLLILLLLL